MSSRSLSAVLLLEKVARCPAFYDISAYLPGSFNPSLTPLPWKYLEPSCTLCVELLQRTQRSN